MSEKINFLYKKFNRVPSSSTDISSNLLETFDVSGSNIIYNDEIYSEDIPTTLPNFNIIFSYNNSNSVIKTESGSSTTININGVSNASLVTTHGLTEDIWQAFKDGELSSIDYNSNSNIIKVNELITSYVSDTNSIISSPSYFHPVLTDALPNTIKNQIYEIIVKGKNSSNQIIFLSNNSKGDWIIQPDCGIIQFFEESSVFTDISNNSYNLFDNTSNSSSNALFNKVKTPILTFYRYIGPKGTGVIPTGNFKFKLPATDGSTNSFLKTDGNGQLFFGGESGGSSQWTTVNTNEIHYSSGNVGIGTNNPSGKLHLSSGTSGNCALIIEADTDNNNESDNPNILFKQDGGLHHAEIGLGDNELILSNSVSVRGGIVFKTGTQNNALHTSTEKMRINSSGNVGIGNTNPSYKLDVAGDINFTGTLRQNGTAFSGGGSSQWTTSGSNIYYNSGNVGIGTTSPSSKLEVNGQLKVQPNVDNSTHAIFGYGAFKTIDGQNFGIYHVNNISSSTSYAIWNNSFGTVKINSLGASSIEFQNHANTMAIITYEGKFGIGTTNPSYKLDVAGDINFTGTLRQNGSVFSGGGSSQWTTSGSNIYYNSGNVGIGNTDPLGKLHIGGNTGITGFGSTLGSLVNNSLIVLHPTQTSSTAINDPKTTLYLGRNGTVSQSNPAGAFFNICRSENSGHYSKTRLDIDLRTNWETKSNVMTMLDSGNVGIGDTSPSYKLDVAGDINFTGTLRQNGNIVSLGGSQWTTSSSNIYYNSGYVGIGTTSPVAKLHVKGGGNEALRIEGTNYASHFFHSTNENTYIRPGKPQGNVLIADVGNNVGIGTNSPSYKLDVTGDINFTGTLRQNGTAFSSSSSQWTTSGSNIYYNSGNVGIGTNSPARELDLSTTGHITFGDAVNVSGGNTSLPGIFWHSDSNYGIYRTSGNWTANNYQQLMVKWNTGIILDPGSGTYNKSHVGVVGGVSIGDTYYTTKSDNNLIVQGNIGIGDTSPSYKLDVAGDINFTGNLRQNGSIVSLGGSQWTTSGSNIYYNGNVGVGTSSAPSNRLRIQLAVDNTFDGLRIDNSSGDFRIVAYTDTTDNSYLQLRNASNTTALKLDTNSNNNSFLNAGNFGIGTSSPSYSLDVSGSGYFSGNVQIDTAGSNPTESSNLLIGNTSSLNSFPASANRISFKSPGHGNYFTFRNKDPDGTFTDLHLAYNFNATPLMTWRNNYKVGINKLEPVETLDVVGTGSFTGQFNALGGSKIVVMDSQDGGTGRGIHIWNESNVNWSIYMGQSGANKSISGGTAVAGAGFTSHAFRFRALDSSTHGFIFENSAEQLLASIRSNDGLSYFAGNMGIGNTSPVHKLDVTGDINFTGNLRQNGTLFQGSLEHRTTFNVTVASKTSSHPYNGSGSSLGYYINDVESPVIEFKVGKTYRFNQSDSSNSGHPFRFYFDSAKSSSYTANVTTNGTAGSSGAYVEITIATITPTKLYYQCSAHGYMGNYCSTEIAIDNLTMTEIGYLDGVTSSIQTQINALSSSSTQWTTSSSNIYYNNGDVGIGTTSPGYKLHVANTTTDNSVKKLLTLESQIQSSGGIYGPALNFRIRWADTGAYFDSAGIAGLEQSGYGGQLGFYTKSSTNVADNTLVERMRINSSGNLGIGTTNPTEKLHVIGDILVDGIGHFTSGTLNDPNTNTTPGIHVGNLISGSSKWPHIQLVSTDTYGGWIDFTASNNHNDYEGRILYTLTDGFSFFTDTAERIRINTTGNVGIGNTSPSEKLDVTGNIKLSGSLKTASVELTQTELGYLDGLTGNIQTQINSLSPAHKTTFTVTVASKTSSHPYYGSGSGSGYYIDNIESPVVQFKVGKTYRFNQNDGSNSGHPFRFYLDAAKSSAFTTNVTTNGTAGSSGAYTEIVITNATPTKLYYQCSAHGYMGNYGAVEISVDNLTTTEIGYLDGVTSSIQTQINSTATQWTTTGSNIYYNSGNVGISHTNPAYSLDVDGTGHFSGMFNALGGSKIVIMNNQDGGTGRGLHIWHTNNSDWSIYMGQPGANKSISGGTAVAGAGFNAHAFRLRVTGTSQFGFVFENSNEQLLASIRGNDGLSYFSGNMGIGNTSPAYKLDVTGDINFTGTLRQNGTEFSGSNEHKTTFNVTVASKTSSHPYNGSGSSLGYFIDTIESPVIQFKVGKTYRFNQSDGSNSSHPILFYYDAAKSSQYTTGVTTSGTAGSSNAYVEIVISNSTPTKLYYQCANHGYMGNYGAVEVSIDNLTMTEIGYLDGVTSSIQTQINSISSNSSQWTTTGNNIYYTTGRVGIGSNSPVSMLHVKVSTNYDGINITNENNTAVFKMAMDTDDSGYIRCYNNTAGNNPGTNGVFFSAKPSTDNYINNGGDFGIGTDTPTEKLEVNGNLKLDNGSTTNNQQGAVIKFDNSYGKTGPNKIMLHGTGYGFGIQASSLTYHAGGNHIFRYGSSWDGTTNGDNGTIGMTLNSGNLGIGTSSPSYRLDVTGDINFTGNLRQNGSIVSLGGSQWTTSGSSIYYNGNVGVGTSSAPSNRLRIQLAVDNTFDGLRIDNSSGHHRIVAYTDTTDNGYLQLRNASNTTALKLDTNSSNNSYLNAGNLGIGTDNPDNKLTISGGALQLSPYSNGTTKFAIYSENNVLQINPRNSTGGYNSIVGLNLKSDGNVGIGTTTPSYKLDVAGDINFTGTLRQNGTAFSGGGSSQWTTSGSNIYYNSGNVGIGTASPNQKLQVDGNIYLGPNNTNRFIHSGAAMGISADGHIRVVADANDTSGTAENGDIIFGAGSNVDMNTNLSTSFPSSYPRNELMRIKGSGNVGIGTTSPARKLDLSTTGQITFGDSVTTQSSAKAGMYWHSSDNYGIYRTDGAWSGNYAQLMLKWATGIILDPGSGNYGKSHVGVIGGVSIGDTYYTTKSDNNLIVQGKVGIGTTSPAGILHLSSGTSGNCALIIEADTDNNNESDHPNILFRQDGGLYHAEIGLGDNELILNNSVSARGGIVFKTGTQDNALHTSTEKMRINSSGNVGIGNTNPSYKLDVTGDINFTGTLRQNGTAFSSGSSQWTTSSSNIYYNSGNVGIGTTSPVAELHVKGGGNEALRIEGTNYVSHFFHSTNENVYIRPGKPQGNVLIADAGNNVGIGTSSPSYKLDVTGDINFTGTLRQNGTAFSSGSSQWTTVNTNEIHYSSGNVGIGTNNPDGKLHISSGTSGDCNLILEADTDNNNESDNPNILFKQDGGQHHAEIGLGDNELILSNSVSGNGGIVFKTGTQNNALHTSTEKMRINSSGNVGIGTNVPSALLQIHKQFTGSGIYPAGNLKFSTNNSNDSWDIGEIEAYIASNNGGTSGFPGGLAFKTKNADSNSSTACTTKMVLDANGNLGIGTTSPVSGFHINADRDNTTQVEGIHIGRNSANGLYDQAIEFVSSGTNGYLDFKKTTGNSDYDGRILYNFPNESFSFMTDSATRMTLNSTGLGIGTTSPSEKLDITGNIKSSGNISIAHNTDTVSYLGRSAISGTGHSDWASFAHLDSNNTGGYALLQNSSGQTNLNSANGQFITFRINNVEKMALDANGNLGIGTTSPSEKLEVNGNLKLDNGSTTNNQQGAVIKFDNSYGKTGPNKIMLHGTNYGFGIQASSLTYHAGGNHIFRYGSSWDGTSNGDNGTIGMTLNSGNLGIGTSSPSYRLDVTGDINFTGTLRQNGTAFSSGSSQWTTSGSNIYYNSGNVGIGNTAPLSKLHIGDDISHDNNRTYNANSLIIRHPTLTSNTVLNDPQELLYLIREGTSSQAYAAAATFKLCRYENSSTHSRTRMDIDLTHDSFNDVNVMSIRSDGNVGIGNTDPLGKLHIGGNTGITGFGSTLGGLVNNSLIVLHPTQTSNTAVNDPKTTLYLGRNGTGAQSNPAGAFFNICRSVNYGTNSKTRLDIDLRTGWESKSNVMTMLDSGNVGIGDTSPSYKLDVAGDINFTGNLRQNGNIVSLGGSQWTTSGNNIYYTTGRVGIGSNSPVSMLHVKVSENYDGINITNENNTAVFKMAMDTDDSGYIRCYNNTAGNAGNNAGTNGVFFSAKPSTDNYINNGGNFGIGTTSPSSILELSKSLSLNTDNSFMINFQNTYLSYYDWAIGPCLRNNDATFCIRGGNNGFSNLNDLFAIHGNGNVGIGTTGPSEKLHVVGDILCAGTGHFTGENNTTDPNTNVTPGVHIGNYSANSGSNKYANIQLVSTDTYGGWIDFTTDSDNTDREGRILYGITTGMIFETDTTERLRIDTTGKVGIGTSSPSKTLHVAGTSIIGSGVNNITPSGVNDPSIQCQSIVLHNNSNTDQMYIRRIASAKYQFQTGNNTGELQLQPYGGNVGIGNTSTSYKLDVNGDINFTGDLRKNGSVVSLGGGSSGFSAGSNSKIIYFYQGGTFDLTNNRSTVGIGTDNPDSNFTLDVVGTDFRFGSGNYSNVWNSGNTADKLKFKLTGKNEGSGTEVGVYFASPGALAGAHKSAIIAKGGVGWSRNDLHFCVNTTTGDNSSSADATISHSKMMIDGENGNIGIGRTSPSYKLDVAGSIRADSTVYNSDDRIKNNESYITNATETIMKLKPQIYDKYNNFDMSGNYERESGLIAQEIYYDVSELRHLVNIGQDADLSNNITTSANPSIDPDYSNWGSEFAGVNYNGLIPYLIKSNQEQQQIINTEKAKAAALETKVQSLETQLASVLSRLTALENNS